MRAQLLLALAAAGGAGADVDCAGVAEAAGGDFLAAAVADQDPLGRLGAELGVGARGGGGDRLGVEGAVEQRQPFVGEGLDRVLGLTGLVQPARRLALAGQGREGADRGRPGQGQRSGIVVGLDSARPAPPPARGRRPDLLQDQDALLALGAARSRQVAPVGQRQGSGEVELDESE